MIRCRADCRFDYSNVNRRFTWQRVFLRSLERVEQPRWSPESWREAAVCRSGGPVALRDSAVSVAWLSLVFALSLHRP